MKKRKLIIITAAALSMTGCFSASRAAFFAIGSPHKVTMYSGGQIVGVWHSVGAVKNEDRSDGYYFEDRITHRLVCVCGQVVIEQE